VVVAPSLITERGAITGRVHQRLECERVEESIGGFPSIGDLSTSPVVVSREEPVFARDSCRSSSRLCCATARAITGEAGREEVKKDRCDEGR